MDMLSYFLDWKKNTIDTPCKKMKSLVYKGYASDWVILMHRAFRFIYNLIEINLKRFVQVKRCKDGVTSIIDPQQWEVF